MQITIADDCDQIDWQGVADILQSVGMASHAPEKHKKAFEASHTTIFLYDQDTLVGFGRAISDGTYQAAVYDCAIATAYQGRGLGRLLLENILNRLPGCNVILYAAPGREGFYEKHGFRRMKTGMALFVNGASMRDKGFTV